MWVRSVVSIVARWRVCEARKTMYGLTPERNSCERIVSLDVEGVDE